MVLQLAFVSPLYLSLAPQRRSGSSLELESNTMKKTENRGLDFKGKVKERERDVVGEMVEVIRAAWMKAIEYHEAHIRKSSAMSCGRERDVDGEMEEKDEVNQIEGHLKAALILIKNCKARAAMSSPMASERTQIQAPESDAKNLQLRLPSSLPDSFYTGNKAEGKFGSAIPVKLIDKSTGHVVTSGPVSCAKLDVVAVDGNFDNEDDDDWTLEDFKSHVVTDRDGKKLLTGNLELSLKEGVGFLGELTFTDNSSWMQNKKIRLGVQVASGICEGFRVREAISNPFVVKDRRGEGCKKHDLPAPDDEVWRLRNIGKNGAFHKKLNEAGIFIVRDFLWKLKLSCQELRKILGTSMSKGKWETLVEHAETCDLSGKYYVYYADNMKSSGVVFENIFEFSWLVEGGEYYSAENLSDSQKVFADTLKRNAWDNFKHTVKYDGPMPSNMNPSKRARTSQTDVVTGVPVPTPFRTPVASRAPAVGGVHSLIAGDGPATSSDPSEQAYESTDMAYEDPIFDSMEDLGGLPRRNPSEQAGGNINMGRGEYVLETLSDHSEQAGGTSDLSLAWERVMGFTTDDEPLLQPAPVVPEQGGGTSDLSLAYYDMNPSEMPIDMNPSERERFPPTDIVTWASENLGIDQQDSTLFGTPVASRDQALVNQWLDIGDYDGLLPIDMNPSERERFPPADTGTWASENFGIDQQDSTLFWTPVASRDQALVNQWLDVGDPPVPFDQQAPVPCQQHSGHFEDRYRMVGSDIQGEIKSGIRIGEI